jgi:hypothetical protein
MELIFFVFPFCLTLPFELIGTLVKIASIRALEQMADDGRQRTEDFISGVRQIRFIAVAFVMHLILWGCFGSKIRPFLWVRLANTCPYIH